MPIRLIACDLDGTLADHDAHISDEAVAAIERARQRGVLVIVATGRMYTVITPFLDRLRVSDEPIISAQGALVSYRDGRVLRRLPLAVDVALEAAEIADRLGAGMVYFTEQQIVAERFVAPPEKYAAWFGEGIVLDPEARKKLDHNLIKFMAIQKDPEDVPALLAELRRHLGPRADVTRSWHWFVEGCAPGADKGAALAWLCEQLGIPRQEVLAIGDGGNDVTMIRWAGIGVAPADGDPAAIAAADWVAPPLDEHPVVATLERFLE